MTPVPLAGALDLPAAAPPVQPCPGRPVHGNLRAGALHRRAAGRGGERRHLGRPPAVQLAAAGHRQPAGPARPVGGTVPVRGPPAPVLRDGDAKRLAAARLPRSSGSSRSPGRRSPRRPCRRWCSRRARREPPRARPSPWTRRAPARRPCSATWPRHRASGRPAAARARHLPGPGYLPGREPGRRRPGTERPARSAVMNDITRHRRLSLLRRPERSSSAGSAPPGTGPRTTSRPSPTRSSATSSAS